MALFYGRFRAAEQNEQRTEEDGAPSQRETSSPTATACRPPTARVVQVRITSLASGSKASIGSGFVVAADGRIATNFHVVSEVVHHPERYRAELVRHDGSATPLNLLAVDVVHDLAIVQAPE